MNNSKFMELSNDEIMEVEGGIIITGTTVLLVVYAGNFVLQDLQRQYKKGKKAGSR